MFKCNRFRFLIIDGPNQTSSLSETKVNKLIKSEPASAILHYTSNYLNKIYPAGYRQDSSNFNPLPSWMFGFQIGWLNFLLKIPNKLNLLSLYIIILIYA
jgi:hypothetical protein